MSLASTSSTRSLARSSCSSRGRRCFLPSLFVEALNELVKLWLLFRSQGSTDLLASLLLICAFSSSSRV